MWTTKDLKATRPLKGDALDSMCLDLTSFDVPPPAQLTQNFHIRTYADMALQVKKIDYNTKARLRFNFMNCLTHFGTSGFSCITWQVGWNMRTFEKIPQTKTKGELIRAVTSVYLKCRGEQLLSTELTGNFALGAGGDSMRGHCTKRYTFLTVWTRLLTKETSAAVILGNRFYLLTIIYCGTKNVVFQYNHTIGLTCFHCFYLF